MENGAISPDCNSFNAEYSKRGILERSEENSTGAEYGNQCKAFTLAEVLITLSIIGVVAALTIPSLISKNNEKETVVRVKKQFNIFSQAYSAAIVENGPPSGWGEGTTDPLSLVFAQKLEPFLNINKNCKTSPGCFPDIDYKFIPGTIWQNINQSGYQKMILADGTLIYINGYSYTCEHQGKVCATAVFDVNGFKGPNTIGKDVFSLWFTKNSVIPVGLKDDIESPLERCRDSGSGSGGCSGWVILKENLDYLKRNVSWDE